MSGPRDWDGLFPEEEIPRILRIVERCASKLRKTKPLELENDLTDRLRDLIDQDRDFRNDVDAELQREVPIYDRKQAKMKPLGRGDLKFLAWAAKKPWPYFLIEAKRLHVEFPSGWASLVPEYVTGHQGMMCFIEERYSRDLASGAMLGFVFDGRTQAACDAVHDLMVKQARKLECVTPYGLSPCEVADTTAEQSRHRIQSRDFILYHLFTAV